MSPITPAETWRDVCAATGELGASFARFKLALDAHANTLNELDWKHEQEGDRDPVTRDEKDLADACRWHVDGSDAPTPELADRWFEITRQLSLPGAMTLQLCDALDAVYMENERLQEALHRCRRDYHAKVIALQKRLSVYRGGEPPDDLPDDWVGT
jgi:hypothetical protein